MLRRRGMIRIASGGSSSVLPGAYQQVEYIECTGTQYIATSYIPTIAPDSMLVNFEHEFTVTPVGEEMIFGAKPSNDGSRIYAEVYNGISFYGANGKYRFAAPSIVAGLFPTLGRRNVCQMNKNVIIYNGVSDNVTNATYTGQIAFPLYIFAWNNAGSAQYLSKGLRIFSLSVSDADSMELDACFVPCYRKSDGVIGMYDTVSQTFYTNAGTGTFVKGGNV